MWTHSPFAWRFSSFQCGNIVLNNFDSKTFQIVAIFSTQSALCVGLRFVYGKRVSCCNRTFVRVTKIIWFDRSFMQVVQVENAQTPKRIAKNEEKNVREKCIMCPYEIHMLPHWTWTMGYFFHVLLLSHLDAWEWRERAGAGKKRIRVILLSLLIEFYLLLVFIIIVRCCCCCPFFYISIEYAVV